MQSVARDVCPAITWPQLAHNANVAMIADIQLFKQAAVLVAQVKVAHQLQLNNRHKAEDLIQQL
jgi:hypothetical protein